MPDTEQAKDKRYIMVNTKKILKISVCVVIAVFFSVVLTGCGYNNSSTGSDSSSSDTSSTSDQVDSNSDTSSTFHGNTCTGDCSGHEAGYDWAEEQGITDPSDCGGNSNSFIEGCESYAEENGDY